MKASSLGFGLSKQLLGFIDAHECKCDGDAVHSHCLVVSCIARIPRHEKICQPCSQRAEPMYGCRSLSKCKHAYFEPPDQASVARHTQLGFCSEKCLSEWLTSELKEVGVPPLYRNCTLDNFIANTPSQRRKIDFLGKWLQNDLHTGLYLFGEVGNGKSHLLAAVIRALAERDIVGQYINGRQFAMRCQASFSKDETIESIMNDVFDGQYLAIDDFGSEKPTEFVRQCVLDLVDRAYTSLTPLIIASNLNLDQVERIEPRIASRLAQMCEVLEFHDGNYRLHLADARAKQRDEGIA